MNSLRLTGLLLDYPSEELWQHQPELLEAVAESPELTQEQLTEVGQGVVQALPQAAFGRQG